ncbi:LysR family transcriptional regulator [Defluviimonas salinarum]|uniref:LysR family transcriptional regulator n=1 Tax=Defluviimonas salinarum TaxID=2992147 RepID=A0ABT3J7G0_9RHOB|nr:LysR family transcriptional regulator [Defluviimonas salinarum]MCW3783619.1 LysR family transcriptional regulator [Defluviimonas salinarum]
MNRVSDIDLRLLRVFVVVVESEGFAAAESVLNVSTSTISLHIGNLESRLGIRLCERGRRGFSLTERGKVVFEETKRLLKTIDDFSGIVASTKSLLAGRLVVGMVDALTAHADFPLAEAIREFNKVKNEVEFDLIVGTRQSLERDVLSGQIHAALGPFKRDSDALNVTPLFYEPHDLYCGEGHPLFGATINDVKNVDFTQYATIQRPYHRGFSVEHFDAVREGGAVNSMEGMLTMLLSGGYLGFLPRHFAKPWEQQGKLYAVDRVSMTYVSEHAVITKKGARESIALNPFVAALKKVATLRRREDG